MDRAKGQPGRLVLLRHGESLWNAEKRFTGQKDVPLTPQGRAQAREAARVLDGYDPGLDFEHIHVSRLARARDTLDLFLGAFPQKPVPSVSSAALDERSYGALEGHKKDGSTLGTTAEALQRLRRPFDAVPPGGESLADTYARVVPYFEREIAPALRAGEDVLVVSHANTLRCLMLAIERRPPESIRELRLENAHPVVYTFDEALRVRSKDVLERPASGGPGTS